MSILWFFSVIFFSVICLDAGKRVPRIKPALTPISLGVIEGCPECTDPFCSIQG